MNACQVQVAVNTDQSDATTGCGQFTLDSLGFRREESHIPPFRLFASTSDLPMKLNRRQFVQTGAVAATAIVASPHAHADEVIRIGYVSPQSGALAPFGEADKWTIEQMRTTLRGGLTVSGRRHNVEIVLKDSQSDPVRAAEVARELIEDVRVSLMLTAGTPETANPVCDACERRAIPCISSVAPWQSWFFGRNGNPINGFNWTYHIFWGLEDVFSSYALAWIVLDTNKKIGALFPDDGDGRAWADKQRGFPKPLDGLGFSLVDLGRFKTGTQDFSAYIEAFKSERVEIVTGVVAPPDAGTFLAQAQQLSFKPKVITLGKALLFPSTVESLGVLGDGLTTEVWWSPSHPFTSSLTNQSARALADAYEIALMKPWTQPIGFAHALFEVAASALLRTKSLRAADVRDAIASTSINTVVGPVRWGGIGPLKNVSKTPLVLGQWGKGKKGRYELTIVNNVAAPKIPRGGPFRRV